MGREMGERFKMEGDVCICMADAQKTTKCYKAIILQLKNKLKKKKKRILEWVAMPSSRGSSWLRDQTHVSIHPALAGGFFTISANYMVFIFLFLTYFSLFIHLTRSDSDLLLCMGWVIFHCIYVSQLLYPVICWWAPRLLPCPSYCKLCCNKHWGYMCLFELWFSQGICPVVGLLGHMILYP